MGERETMQDAMEMIQDDPVKLVAALCHLYYMVGSYFEANHADTDIWRACQLSLDEAIDRVGTRLMPGGNAPLMEYLDEIEWFGDRKFKDTILAKIERVKKRGF